MRLGYRSNGWNFSSERRDMFLYEYEDWLKHYLPISMKGLTVLDVGAGEGETARFYLEHGAKKVLCIEPDKACFIRLRENALGRPLECFHKRFSVDDLYLPFDFMKMDIEGYEETLLDVLVEKPCVVEVHGLQLREKFGKAGYTIRNRDVDGYSSYAYKIVGKRGVNNEV
jgi:SAM-dependent methyltransferase